MRNESLRSFVNFVLDFLFGDKIDRFCPRWKSCLSGFREPVVDFARQYAVNFGFEMRILCVSWIVLL